MKNLLIALTFGLLGYILSGCDEMGNAEMLPDGGATDALPATKVDTTLATGGTVATGLSKTANGSVYCSIPSPTGDVINTSTGMRARDQAMLTTNKGTMIVFVVVSNAAKAEALCMQTGTMTSAQCKNAANDFIDSTGTKHCYMLTGEPGTGACHPSADGTKTCNLSMFQVLSDNAPEPRLTAICSTEGKFMGWSCNY